MPTVFESNTPFKDIQAILDALDDYLAYRYVQLTRCVYRIMAVVNRISTFFAGPNFGFGDAVIWGTIKGQSMSQLYC